MKLSLKVRTASAASALAMAFSFGSANAGVIYQSIPDLTVWTPVNGICSACSFRQGSYVGQTFTLSSAAVADTLFYDVTSWYNWPTRVTVDIFQDAGSNTLGANVFHQTFMDGGLYWKPTGNFTDVVAADLGSLHLAAGTYDLFLTNPGDLSIPVYPGGPIDGGLLQQSNPDPNPVAGQSYGHVSGIYTGSWNAGIRIDGSFISAVPEPATWTMAILGVAMIGFAARRRSGALALAA